MTFDIGQAPPAMPDEPAPLPTKVKESFRERALRKGREVELAALEKEKSKGTLRFVNNGEEFSFACTTNFVEMFQARKPVDVDVTMIDSVAREFYTPRVTPMKVADVEALMKAADAQVAASRVKFKYRAVGNADDIRIGPSIDEKTIGQKHQLFTGGLKIEAIKPTTKEVEFVKRLEDFNQKLAENYMRVTPGAQRNPIMNRQTGRFYVHRRILNDDWMLSQKIFSRLVILSTREIGDTESVLEYTAVGEPFDAVAPGEYPPTYTVEIEQRAFGDKVVNFVREKS